MTHTHHVSGSFYQPSICEGVNEFTRTPPFSLTPHRMCGRPFHCPARNTYSTRNHSTRNHDPSSISLKVLKATQPATAQPSDTVHDHLDHFRGESKDARGRPKSLVCGRPFHCPARNTYSTRNHDPSSISLKVLKATQPATAQPSDTVHDHLDHFCRERKDTRGRPKPRVVPQSECL
jgi:hypothetical protein